MARENLADQLICQRPRTWYLAVGGTETVRGAMGNLQALQDRLQKQHIQAAIFDFRQLDGMEADDSWQAFTDGLEVTVPFGMPIGWLACEKSAPAAQALARIAQKAGALSQLCLNWPAAVSLTGLPASAPDPLRARKAAPKAAKTGKDEGADPDTLMLD